MSKIVLYSHDISPPCRAVLLTAEAIGVTLTIHETNLFKKDQLSEEFQKINPQHTIPTLDDNGFILWDSHAIMSYLIDKFAKDDTLYPKDLQKRASIDQQLHFETGMLFALLKGTFKPIFFYGAKSIPQEQVDAFVESFTILNKMLEGKNWLVGDHYTIADISCVISALTVLDILPDSKKFPNVLAWMKRCEETIPGYKKIVLPADKELKSILKSKMA